MGFATALSGLAAAAANLQVIGNNIANANTIGFKESRAEFADVYNSAGNATPGAGVRVTEVAQQFSQGNVEATQNNLDLALSGNGFFSMGVRSDSTSPTAYTRNGAFHLSPEGFITNDTGYFLMGGAPIGTKIEEGFSTGAPIALKVDTSQGAPSATTKIDLKVNVDSREGRPVIGFSGYDFNTSTGPDVATYNSSTSATVFDSLGNTHTLSTYFVNETPDGAATSTWAAYVYLDGRGLNAGATATLDTPDSALATTILAAGGTDAASTVTAAVANVTASESTVTATAAAVTTTNATTLAAADAAADAGVLTAFANIALSDAALVTATAVDAVAANTDAAFATAVTDATTAAADAVLADTAADSAKTAAAAAVTSGTNADAILAKTAADLAKSTADTAKISADKAAAAEAVGAVLLTTGATAQQIAAARAAYAATSPLPSASSVLTAAGAAELAGTKIPVTFDSLGNLTAEGTGTTTASGNTDDNFLFSNIDIAPLLSLNVSASPLTLSINPTGSTQYAADFGVNDLQQNGFASGNLTGVSFDKTGVLLARYSNGTTSPLGQVILGRFTNNQGLGKLGDTTWQESIESGTAVLGVAGGNNFGDITASALENSNTDIATQLVKMIVAQQAYQANAQTISTEDEIIQRILQL